MHLRMPSAVSKALSPGVWSLLGTQLCCHPQQPEEPSRSRCLLWRPLCSRRLSFWILFRPLGLTPPLVRIYCQGEYKVQFDVPVVTGRRPEVYRHLKPLQQTLGKLLWLILQHGCGGLTLEMGKGDLTNRVPSRRPVPHGMEPETSEGEGSHGFTSFCYDLLSCHIQKRWDVVTQLVSRRSSPRQ